MTPSHTTWLPAPMTTPAAEQQVDRDNAQEGVARLACDTDRKIHPNVRHHRADRHRGGGDPTVRDRERDDGMAQRERYDAHAIPAAARPARSAAAKSASPVRAGPLRFRPPQPPLGGGRRRRDIRLLVRPSLRSRRRPASSGTSVLSGRSTRLAVKLPCEPRRESRTSP